MVGAGAAFAFGFAASAERVFTLSFTSGLAGTGAAPEAGGASLFDAMLQSGSGSPVGASDKTTLQIPDQT